MLIIKRKVAAGNMNNNVHFSVRLIFIEALRSDNNSVRIAYPNLKGLRGMLNAYAI